MQKEQLNEKSPMNDDTRIKSRKEAARVLKDEEVRTAVARELDVSTAKLEIARAYMAQVTGANIKALEEDKTLSPEDKKKAIAKQKMQLDSAEMNLENHVEWREFVTNTFNI